MKTLRKMWSREAWYMRVLGLACVTNVIAASLGVLTCALEAMAGLFHFADLFDVLFMATAGVFGLEYIYWQGEARELRNIVAQSRELPYDQGGWLTHRAKAKLLDEWVVASGPEKSDRELIAEAMANPDPKQAGEAAAAAELRRRIFAGHRHRPA